MWTPQKQWRQPAKDRFVVFSIVTEKRRLHGGNIVPAMSATWQLICLVQCTLAILLAPRACPDSGRSGESVAYLFLKDEPEAVVHMRPMELPLFGGLERSPD